MRFVLSVHEWCYRKSRGLVGHRILGVPCLLLETTGRRSGLLRVHALVYLRDGEDLVVVASAGGAPNDPAWFVNLVAHPSVVVQVARRRAMATARVLRPGDAEYARLWAAVNAHNRGRYDRYQSLTSRPICLVVLTPDEQLP